MGIDPSDFLKGLVLPGSLPPLPSVSQRLQESLQTINCLEVWTIKAAEPSPGNSEKRYADGEYTLAAR